MNFLNFFANLNGDIIKNKLIASGIDASKLQGIDFSNMQQLNKLAEEIMPGLIKSNPNIANMIKQNSSMLSPEKQKEIANAVDNPDVVDLG